MALTAILIAKLALLVAPIVIKETNKFLYISKQEKKITELQDEVSRQKLEIGNYCYEKYGDSSNVSDKIIGATLTSISDVKKEISELEDKISEILLQYPEAI